MSQPITAVVCGAGQRAYYAYGPYALQHPEDLRFVAVAEPDQVRRDRFGDAHGIPAGRLHALQPGPYGRCVYRCDNDVVDHQVVNLEFAGGAIATLVMHGHAHEEARTTRYNGTRATLRARFTYAETHLEIHDHLTGRCEEIAIPEAASGHGGGDFGVVRSFVKALRGDAPPLTTARESLESHLLAFAAEESRLDGGTAVDMADFRRRAEALASPA